ncbi:MAG TPA: FdhF/YdeP family oxidoreductase [Cryptosporangiaceae bacterium]|nr:FdhF/YdeP family oxidoreductase [Cryptosporangiaceae bacterium]
MTSRRPAESNESPRVRPPKRVAAGVAGVMAGLDDSLREMGVSRSVRTLRVLNQPEGFDCPGCAWPDPPPGERRHAEFCENGAKAVAEEATRHRVTPEFFAAHPVSELATRTDHWLGRQGRLTEPMVKPPGADHYQPISWDDAFALVARHLRAVDPDQAVFYTSGRTSNEAAFAYQLFARAYGTNNLPDCSNMCHESSGVALNQTIGIGKGSVTLDDLHHAELIVVTGQNPGSNHPRMLTALATAKANGARILAVNPLPEAGLIRFKDPQTVRGVVGGGVPLADEYLQIRLGGDLALFQAIGAALLDAERTDGGVLDHEFLAGHTHGFGAYAEHLSALDAADVADATGLAADEIGRAAEMFRGSKRTVVCWAMGLTQHRDAVATIREVVNVLLLQGNLGRPGAGLCPVRGHSNVQGDRTMGITEEPTAAFLDGLTARFGFAPPRESGLDVVAAIRAMRDGKASVFVGLGGNFAAATPDTEVTTEALRRCALTVQVSTKLNRSHTVCGATALILPCLGRTERDVQAGGEQVVTVEDSMSSVHPSRGRLEPASPSLRSEVAIVCGIAAATLGDRHGIDWAAMRDDYGVIREHITAVVPGCDGYDARSVEPGGYTLPHPPRDARRFTTSTGRANFTVNTLTVLRTPPGRLLLQTVRSHDQYNTTIYGMDDRYRGVTGGRRVVFVHPSDLDALGLADGVQVDIVSEWNERTKGHSSVANATAERSEASHVSEWPDDPAGVTERRVTDFRVVAYPTAPGCAAAYFPETNALLPLDHTAEGSNQPVAKSLVVRLERH